MIFQKLQTNLQKKIFAKTKISVETFSSEDIIVPYVQNKWLRALEEFFLPKFTFPRLMRAKSDYRIGKILSKLDFLGKKAGKFY